MVNYIRSTIMCKVSYLYHTEHAMPIFRSYAALLITHTVYKLCFAHKLIWMLKFDKFLVTKCYQHQSFPSYHKCVNNKQPSSCGSLKTNVVCVTNTNKITGKHPFVMETVKRAYRVSSWGGGQCGKLCFNTYCPSVPTRFTT